MGQSNLSTRDIGRHAVRKELADAAFNQFCMTGFDAVTFADLAGATGVSRSTFLRYFATKEDVVLFVFDPVGDTVAAALRDSAGEPSDWRRLRGALEPAVRYLTKDIEHVVTIVRLTEQTPALYARLKWRQAQWCRDVVEVLAPAVTSDRGSSLEAQVRVAAALECLWIALVEWCRSDGDEDLGKLLDLVTAALRD